MRVSVVRKRVRYAVAFLLLGVLAVAAECAEAKQSRQRLVRIGDIAFGTSFEDAWETADAAVGNTYLTGDRRALKTLAQTKVAMFGTAFNLTYVFGNDDRLTRVFGSVVRSMDKDKQTCLSSGADVFAATVHQYGSPDFDQRTDAGREWRFDFNDGRWIRFRYYFGGVLGACNIILDSVTPEGKNDRS